MGDEAHPSSYDERRLLANGLRLVYTNCPSLSQAECIIFLDPNHTEGFPDVGMGIREYGDIESPIFYEGINGPRVAARFMITQTFRLSSWEDLTLYLEGRLMLDDFYKLAEKVGGARNKTVPGVASDAASEAEELDFVAKNLARSAKARHLVSAWKAKTDERVPVFIQKILDAVPDATSIVFAIIGKGHMNQQLIDALGSCRFAVLEPIQGFDVDLEKVYNYYLLTEQQRKLLTEMLAELKALTD